MVFGKKLVQRRDRERGGLQVTVRCIFSTLSPSTRRNQTASKDSQVYRQERFVKRDTSAQAYSTG